MSQETEPLDPDDLDEVLAAELALGLLQGDEAQLILARLADPDFQARVQAWQERLASLTEDLTPVLPPARTRQRIREALGHAQPLFSQPIETRPRWWQRPWALFGGAVAVLALALVWLMPMLPERTTPAPGWRAELAAADQGLRVAAQVSGREFRLQLQSGPAAEGRDWEIWWIKPDGSAPISLGVVPRQGELRAELPAGLDPGAGVQIALSDEPAGGSPTGQATGPVVAIAPLTAS
ncbi:MULTISPECIES: anti-sigma factor [unclassified Paracoccus (in: a-proteobacteria)]|uniref:anti-sigma factor n=1 Tax=unclassified Paracoccus (in: a-proteobacteria) TaxID=2688777 RepID=UPI0012B40833|nr:MULTISPECIES: anti-sigma factor [unclassified Paracoccus (in: a-proteobacteria)]